MKEKTTGLYTFKVRSSSVVAIVLYTGSQVTDK